MTESKQQDSMGLITDLYLSHPCRLHAVLDGLMARVVSNGGLHRHVLNKRAGLDLTASLHLKYNKIRI